MAERGRHEQLAGRNTPEWSAAPSPGRLPEVFGRRYLTAFDTDELEQHSCNVLVIGSGIAGLTAALAAGGDNTVALVTKARIRETNTWYAQGGIAGAMGEADSVELHLADTLVVGQGICDEDVVRAVVSEAGDALRDLLSMGVPFDRDNTDGEPALAREGGHSLPRILHSGDSTGAAIQDTLASMVRNARGVEVFEERFLIDLLTAGERCVGALVYNPQTHSSEVFWADAVILGTGGSGQVYRVTTNPLIATGDGVAAAWRAGAQIADLEFVQFHPTAFDSAASPKFLITEALRGEGARLLDCNEERFMLGVHELAELAPRDVVSREIEKVMARCGRPNVWLDARHLGAEFLEHRFPTIWATCLEAGFDLSRDLVPVAPAAHYMIGGVRVDIDGRTSLPGLFAAGEVTASGLHGANRLASNSLLEGLVFSRRIVRVLGSAPARRRAGRIVSGDADSSAAFSLERARDTVQNTMSTFVGMTRSSGSLAEAAHILHGLAGVLGVSLRRPAEIELQNLVTVATLIAHAAWMRTESRGTHSRVDFPARDDGAWLGHTIWQRGAAPRFEPEAAACPTPAPGEDIS